MVKVAVAGGTGNVATNVLKASITSGKHDITILTRALPKTTSPGIAYKQIDYYDLTSLTSALQGFDVCLSFLVAHLDPHCIVQKNLIHACIEAGVRRFAPSEWGIKNNSGVPPYENKDTIARYLAELKDTGMLHGLEYCLFQPSIFVDYFAHPHPLSPELFTWPFFIDFEQRRAIVLDDGEHPLVLTAISDDSEMLALALEDSRPWPEVGGIRGCSTTINKLIALGREIRGGKWSIEHVSSEDIAQGQLKTSWVPEVSHPTVPQESRDVFSKDFVIWFLQAIANGSWNVSGEWNQRFPQYRFWDAEEYLRKAWEGST
ncbi:similar to NmrA-like family protein [Plenodomus lingam JN3]|uniref:Similar to NmrA-like family protein n=1 Tax=Leptosphaeria maculans (strain JN3 / isolate v23.1.3 / race Av1-4-5-6-7-8) TaxID=985895 RepID=E5R4E4_LEPMJ|nr:similar to NmrA-like family protein [Plenodomus lingam JN3]CBX91912.1 similar to NmrA-like family protein [Plenodomus lingam JN3]